MRIRTLKRRNAIIEYHNGYIAYLEQGRTGGVSADRLRTAIACACKASGVPVFSPHDLRHRRISLLHRRGRSWAEIGPFVGQRKLSVTAETYTHVLSDGRELDYGSVL